MQQCRDLSKNVNKPGHSKALKKATTGNDEIIHSHDLP